MLPLHSGGRPQARRSGSNGDTQALIATILTSRNLEISTIVTMPNLPTTYKTTSTSTNNPTTAFPYNNQWDRLTTQIITTKPSPTCPVISFWTTIPLGTRSHSFETWTTDCNLPHDNPTLTSRSEPSRIPASPLVTPTTATAPPPVPISEPKSGPVSALTTLLTQASSTYTDAAETPATPISTNPADYKNKNLTLTIALPLLLIFFSIVAIATFLIYYRRSERRAYRAAAIERQGGLNSIGSDAGVGGSRLGNTSDNDTSRLASKKASGAPVDAMVSSRGSYTEEDLTDPLIAGTRGLSPGGHIVGRPHSSGEEIIPRVISNRTLGVGGDTKWTKKGYRDYGDGIPKPPPRVRAPDFPPFRPRDEQV